MSLPSPLWPLLWLGLALAFGLRGSPAVAFKVPLPRQRRTLPILPRQISWPVMNNLHSDVDLLPSYVGSVVPDAAAVGLKGACFFENEALLEFIEHDEDGDRESANGSAILHIKANSMSSFLLTDAAHSWTCMDLYVFATPYRIIWDYYFSAREHTLVIKSWEERAEMEMTLLSLVDVLPLFSNIGWGQNANLAFLEKHMDATFEKRSRPHQATVRVEDIHSGDFLAVSKIRGRWGGFETLEKWVTGAFAGHTAVCLKDNMGNLWVGESGHENEKGEEIIVVIPWDEWWDLAMKDDSNPQMHCFLSRLVCKIHSNSSMGLCS